MIQKMSQTVSRALHLLDFFSDSEELGISELSLLMGLDKTTIFRLVSSLSAAGFLQQNEQTKKYRLGMKLLYFGTLVEERNELAVYAHPYMKKISDKYQVTTLLSILESNQTRIIQKVSAGPFVYMAARVGLLLPAYSMASGKLLLANSDQENIHAYLSSTSLTPMTSNTITDPAVLAKEFEKIRRCGYAKDNGEATVGLSCLAVPVHSSTQKVIAALSVSGQSEIIESEESAMLCDLQEISSHLGTYI